MIDFFGERGGDRTHDPVIKSHFQAVLRGFARFTLNAASLGYTLRFDALSPAVAHGVLPATGPQIGPVVTP